jgi:O-acetyl-ADP-ribose deacetylase (regulator of RNase III)
MEASFSQRCPSTPNPNGINMKTTDGDLITLALAGESDVMVHGCNYHCNMGGLAKTIK